jgi:hypothetical protein
MDFDEFISYLKQSLPDNVDWYVDQSRFKGNDLVGATIKFNFPVQQDEEE